MWSQAGDGLRPGWGGWDGEGEAGEASLLLPATTALPSDEERV